MQTILKFILLILLCFSTLGAAQNFSLTHLTNIQGTFKDMKVSDNHVYLLESERLLFTDLSGSQVASYGVVQGTQFLALDVLEDRYLYLASNNFLDIYDLANIASMSYLSSVDLTTLNSKYSANTVDATYKDNYVVLTYPPANTDVLQNYEVINVSDVNAPSILSRSSRAHIQNNYLYSIENLSYGAFLQVKQYPYSENDNEWYYQVDVSDVNGNSFIDGFAIDENYFYISYLLDNGQHAFDITNIDTKAYNDYTTTAKILTINDNYLFTVDNGKIDVWDVSEKNSAFSIFQTSTPSYSNDEIYKAFANGNNLYIISKNRGLDIYSISLSQTYDKRDFVTRLYTTLLGRAYDEGGLNYFVSELEKGKSALEVSKSFFFSAEFQNANLSTGDFLTRLYKTFLDRDPDQDGLNYWSDQINNKGKTRRLVFYEFAFSTEFQQLSSQYGITPYSARDKLIGFIERLYVLVMGRESDGGGMDFWVGKLSANEKSGSDIVKDYYNAPEFTGKNLTNPQFVSNAYNAVMGREADTGGLNYWVGKMNNEGLARNDVLEQFIHSPEFEQLAKEYGIDPYTEDLPKDFENQPAYNGHAHNLTDDYDQDGLPDFLDLFPYDKSKQSVQILAESEFNNNIGQSNAAGNNRSFPFAINGELKKGSSYYLDSDYFKIDAAKGNRVSFLVFKGTSNSSNPIIDTDFSTICTPLISVLNSEGKKVFGKTISLFDGNINGTGIQIPQDGDLYLQISDSTLTASDYACSYTVLAIEDTDFDGVSDELESLLESNKENSDTDDDGIDDFSEIYPFINKFLGINNGVISPSGQNWWDMDGDGIPNWYDVDSDGDKMPDKREKTDDFDQDLIPNFLDQDSNNDGIDDKHQSGGSYQFPSDIDQDGIADFADIDIDGDGIPNSVDSDTETAKSSNNVFDDNAIELLYVEGIIDADTMVRDTVIPDKELTIYARNIDKDTQVLFPVSGGKRAVKPKSFTSEKLVIDVPTDAVSGDIYLFNGTKLSNSYNIKITNFDKDPLIYSVEPNSVEAGQSITIKGKNLSEEQINVVFEYNNDVIRSAGKADNNVVTVVVPAGAPSGSVYVEITPDIVTNTLPITILKTVGATVTLPFNSTLNYSEISILKHGESVLLNSSYRANINVQNESLDFLAAFVTKNDESVLLYESIVLPDETNIEINALSTAVKWVFFGLHYDRSQPKDKWKDIADKIKSMPETTVLANYIDELLLSDYKALSKFEDVELGNKLQNAIISSGEAVSSMIVSKSLRAAANPLKGEILPSETQDDITISFKQEDDEVNTLVTNGNNMYLSVKAVNENKKVLSSHITHPFDKNKDHGLIGPTGWFFYSNKTIANDGEDTHLEIITGGLRGDLKDPATDTKRRVHSYVAIRTLFDGALTPVVDSLLSYVVDKKFNGAQSYQLIIALIGSSQWSSYMDAIAANPSNMGDIVVNVVKTAIWDKGIAACYTEPTSPVCGKFASALGITKSNIVKKITKKIISYNVPFFGQVKAAIDSAGHIKNAGTTILTSKDFMLVHEEVNFDVEFGLEINYVLPSCISSDSKVDHLNVYASGVNPVQAHFWGGEYINPEVYLGSEKLDINSISKRWGGSWGKQINILLTEDFKNSLSDGQYILKVKDDDDEVEYDELIDVYTNSINLEDIYPDKGSPGKTVTLHGCGWSKNVSENRVMFPNENGSRTEAVVTEANPGYLKVIVPDDAVTGEVYVTYKSNTSNRVLFTIEVDNVTITYGDNGSDNDDTFELFVDNELISSMSSPRRPFPVNVDLAQGRHTVKLVGITAPDDVGTYSISFSSNVSVISGPSLSGSDLTAGVTKTWTIEVSSGTRSRNSESSGKSHDFLIHYNIANE